MSYWPAVKYFPLVRNAAGRFFRKFFFGQVIIPRNIQFLLSPPLGLRE